MARKTDGMKTTQQIDRDHANSPERKGTSDKHKLEGQPETIPTASNERRPTQGEK